MIGSIIKSLLFILIIISVNGCYTKVIESQNLDDKEFTIPEGFVAPLSINFDDFKSFSFLLKEWKHSREEEKDSIVIYRPGSSTNFPPARFRETIEFFKDGKLKFLNIGGGDAHYFTYGAWAVNKNDNSIILLIYSHEKKIKIKIVELNDDILSYVVL